jgi:restriction system protein
MVGALLRRDGFAARLVGGGNDMAVDVIGTRADSGCVLAVQCKHTATGRKVAVPVLYQIFGTAAACYSASHQIVVTNGGFTASALAWGRDPSHRVHLVDRALLAQWLAGRSILELIAEPALTP